MQCVLHPCNECVSKKMVSAIDYTNHIIQWLESPKAHIKTNESELVVEIVQSQY